MVSFYGLRGVCYFLGFVVSGIVRFLEVRIETIVRFGQFVLFLCEL